MKATDTNLGIWIALGAAVGTVAFVLTSNVVWIGAGAALGVALWVVFGRTDDDDQSGPDAS
ncbi:MAG: hypothetical protein LLG14_08315 [Nocardiaceae bacterium]|nr:hypothetical protein [Nocardiaceae bacterium]